MRLICPNCDAQYEVGDSVIPNGGRDVQCSSCGKTWFQGLETLTEGESDVAGASPTAPEPELRKPDEAVLDILREEAAHETKARQGETQPETGAKASARAARSSGGEPQTDKSAQRSDLLPDVEEISSTLRAESASEVESASAEKRRGRSGFRLGFGLVLILATFLLLAYAYAPLIVEKVPESEPYMISYVEKVNDLRLWLDQLLKSATNKMSGTSATGS